MNKTDDKNIWLGIIVTIILIITFVILIKHQTARYEETKAALIMQYIKNNL